MVGESPRALLEGATFTPVAEVRFLDSSHQKIHIGFFRKFYEKNFFGKIVNA
jgi:hypothetical protein